MAAGMAMAAGMDNRLLSRSLHADAVDASAALVWSRERAMAMRASKASSSYAAKGQRDAADRARNALKDVQQKRRKQKRDV